MPSKPNLHEFIIRLVKKNLGKSDEATLSRYEYAKGARILRRSIWMVIRGVLFMMLGVTSAAFGLEGFLIPNGFIDGGVTGISLLIHGQTGIPLSILLLVINLPFLLLGWRQVGSWFAIKSILSIAALALVVAYVPFPAMTHDKLLVAVFGGFFLGVGIGLTIRGGAVIDGTEILAIFLSRKRSLSVGDFILVFNIIIFSFAAYLLSIEIALYSILTYMSASKMVDFTLDGIEEFTGITIISPHSEEIAKMIKEKLRRGLTIYSGKRGYGKSGDKNDNTDIIFTVITRLEISRLTSEVEKIDPNSFIVMQTIKDTRGGMVRRRPLK